MLQKDFYTCSVPCILPLSVCREAKVCQDSLERRLFWAMHSRIRLNMCYRIYESWIFGKMPCFFAGYLAPIHHNKMGQVAEKVNQKSLRPMILRSMMGSKKFDAPLESWQLWVTGKYLMRGLNLPIVLLKEIRNRPTLHGTIPEYPLYLLVLQPSTLFVFWFELFYFFSHPRATRHWCCHFSLHSFYLTDRMGLLICGNFWVTSAETSKIYQNRYLCIRRFVSVL